jgi:hypothetical protein
MENISTIQLTRIKGGIGRKEESANKTKRSTRRNMDTTKRRKRWQNCE